MTDAAEAGLLPLAHLPVAEQLSLREARVREALSRARLNVEVSPIVPSPRAEGARARVRLRADRSGRLGFHRPGSHDWVHVPLAPIARPEVVAEAARVEAWGGARGTVEIRSDGEQVTAVLEQPGDLEGNVAVGNRALRGDPVLRVGGLRVSPLSFYPSWNVWPRRGCSICTPASATSARAPSRGARRPRSWSRTAARRPTRA
jgi:hypothetical protein